MAVGEDEGGRDRARGQEVCVDSDRGGLQQQGLLVAQVVRDLERLRPVEDQPLLDRVPSLSEVSRVLQAASLRVG